MFASKTTSKLQIERKRDHPEVRLVRGVRISTFVLAKAKIWSE